jgi:hypothetical protein
MGGSRVGCRLCRATISTGAVTLTVPGGKQRGQNSFMSERFNIPILRSGKQHGHISFMSKRFNAPVLFPASPVRVVGAAPEPMPAPAVCGALQVGQCLFRVLMFEFVVVGKYVMLANEIL